ncbi:hypothetical protein SKAU_G00346280 [Synaphobranchus kaupii]|uniref:Uncharacterized protein n=1 Tax=Synaphobranchus kaupii TaxID=118154 RepID=A0A9Q1EJM3_SYNKA|nr:hypothetical protein SKAU_G00346280 [Synaphobranchus kaupii]
MLSLTRRLSGNDNRAPVAPGGAVCAATLTCGGETAAARADGHASLLTPAILRNPENSIASEAALCFRDAGGRIPEAVNRAGGGAEGSTGGDLQEGGPGHLAVRPVTAIPDGGRVIRFFFTKAVSGGRGSSRITESPRV